MRPVFSPAIALMGRLNYTRKFVLLWLISSIAIAVVMYSLFVSLNRVIQPSLRQLEGLALIKPISQTVQLIQQHRGLSAALLGGNKTIRDRRAAKEKEAGDAFNAIEEKLPARLSSDTHWRVIKTNWERLRNDGFDWTVVENFAAHTHLIDQILLFEATVSDEYMLTLDAEIGTFYLIDTVIYKLPGVLEHLGQIRAYGAGILAEKQATDQQKMNMNTLVIELGDALRFLEINLKKTGSYTQSIQGVLSMASKDITSSAQQIVGIVESDIITGRFTTPSEDFLKINTMAIDRGYTQMYASLLPTTEALIRERIAKAENVLYLSTGIAILLFLIAAYFAIGVYYVISDSIKLLANSARAFASGDMCVRVNLGTRDELSQIGNSFNEMAEGFSAMLTCRKEAEKALIENQERLQAVIETTLDAVVQMDAEGIITGWNSQAEKIFGWTREEVVGRMLHETIIPPQYRMAHVNGLKCFLLTGKLATLNSRVELLGLHRDGHEFAIELCVTAVKTADKYEFSGFIHNITNRKQSEENIHRLAFYDPLTNLPNRRLLLDRLQHALATSARSGRHGAIMFIDLDSFKVINDTKGHNFGDLLLIEVAHRLQSCVREGDTVARLGGDEFVVILGDLGAEAEQAAAQTEEVGEKILAVLGRPYLIKEHEFHCTASIGTNLFIGRGSSADELLKYADIAMYQAKKAGRNAIRFFDPGMQAVLEARTTLEADLHYALAGQQFRLYYQAQVGEAGRIFGAEVLVRWIHPQRGMVPPSQFIPLAEESSLILDIGQWVLETACQQLASWSNDGQKCNLVLAVNVSARQFKLKDFVDRVAAVIQKHRINPSRLKLELTESMVLDDLTDIVAKMHALKALGVGLSMDDFGTGYSSLSYLKQLPLDQLKIDRSFVNDIVTDPIDAVMVRTIIDLAHNFGLNVVAEGVETDAQLAFLKRHSCMAYQGYLFSEPATIEEFEALLNANVVGMVADITSKSAFHLPVQYQQEEDFL